MLNVWTFTWRCRCSKVSVYLRTYNTTREASCLIMQWLSLFTQTSEVPNETMSNAQGLWMIDWEVSSKCQRRPSCSSYGFLLILDSDLTATFNYSYLRTSSGCSLLLTSKLSAITYYNYVHDLIPNYLIACFSYRMFECNPTLIYALIHINNCHIYATCTCHMQKTWMNVSTCNMCHMLERTHYWNSLREDCGTCSVCS